MRKFIVYTCYLQKQILINFDFARGLVENDNLRVADKEKEFLKYYPGTSEAT